MGRIRVLPDIIVHQIAAGEVIERPFSVVRELVDNSIDAEATAIRILIEDGGRRLISVVDDGCGMSKEEALLAFENHATSKITHISDLNKIRTLGFRGEALPSIASVSDVEMITVRKGEECGTKLSLSGGKVRSVSECSGSHGTSVNVMRLFYNVPVRRRFLRQSRTEEARIKDWLLSYSISHPSVHFRLYFNGVESVNLPRTNNSLDRIRMLPNFEEAIMFNREYAGIRVSGMVCHPSKASKRAGSQTIIVNRRVVSDYMISKAIRSGFESTLKIREYPRIVVMVEVPIEDVDCNVHPQKSEVRFAKPNDVFIAVRNAVSNAISKFNFPVSLGDYPMRGDITEIPQGGRKVRGDTYAGNVALKSSIYEEVAREQVPNNRPNEEVQLNIAKDVPQSNSNLLFKEERIRYIGKVLGCFLIFESGEEEIMLIDMHAAHERINYNKIRDMFNKQKIHSQRFITPTRVLLDTAEQFQRIVNNKEVLKKAGICIETGKENEILILSAPTFLTDETVRDVIVDFSNREEACQEDPLDSARDMICAVMACHSSIRKGDRLSETEARILLRDLHNAHFAGACPHGRPVMIKVSRSQIEKWFGRDK